MLGGHCEIELDRVRVPVEDVLGEVDEGFRHAQVRLGPARLTHVMRWLGAAQRAHEVAVAYVSDRSAFGRPLAQHGMVELMIADNELDLAATRSLLLTAAAALDSGANAREESSLAKVFGAEALHRVADRAVQMCGGAGVSADLPVARIAREIRPFRIYDGPSEVHRMALARRAVRRYGRQGAPPAAEAPALPAPPRDRAGAQAPGRSSPPAARLAAGGALVEPAPRGGGHPVHHGARCHDQAAGRPQPRVGDALVLAEGQVEQRADARSGRTSRGRRRPATAARGAGRAPAPRAAGAAPAPRPAAATHPSRGPATRAHGSSTPSRRKSGSTR